MDQKISKRVGKIGLENLMSRANIVFTSGYVFKGQIDLDKLEQSFTDIIEKITKFSHKLDHSSQSNYEWREAGPFKNRFLRITAKGDIYSEFKNIGSRCFQLVEESNNFPMLIAVIEPDEKADENDEFIIAQLSEHTHFDAGSSEVIFNEMIEYYNALVSNDSQKAKETLDQISKLLTIDSNEMVNLLQKEDFNHQDNVDKLVQYPVADIGEYRLSPDSIDDHLEAYKKRTRTPIIQHFMIHDLVEQCRSKYPEVTVNSIVSAALAKATHLVNTQSKNHHHEHLISFKMLSNLLPVEMRKQYSGNYIAFMPVSVDGHYEIEEISKAIHERICEFKSTQQNLSLFSLVEEAVKASQVGTVDEEISFIVTNWNNYTFLKKREYLYGCESVKHLSAVNIEPKDTLGALLVNRPVMVINLSPDDSLTLSYFPSLRSDEETMQIAEAMKQILPKASYI